jgi:putative transposase
MSAVAISRLDLDAAGLRRAAACSKDAAAARRRRALALVPSGVSRTETC